MSFLYPVFLAAGLCLAIPVLIHLFNLRRYKTILFPHTRFLKNIQLNSRRQSQVRYKWLLLTRLLFLASLVLAFAQPFFNSASSAVSGSRLQVIYIDNSYSMSATKGAQTMLDLAKTAARRQLRNVPPGTRFVLMTNDRPASYRAEPADKVFAEITGIDVAASVKTVNQVLGMVQGVMENEGVKAADIYYYSDFQQNSFPAAPPASLMKNVNFYALPVQPEEVANVHVDTAFLTMPVLQAGKSNAIVVRTVSGGTAPKEKPVLNLLVNGQVKSAASLDFTTKKECVDTLTFQVSSGDWQKMELRISEGGMRFDDTFRITARSSPNLSVLVLNDGQPNPYIQAAFRAYNGFRLNQADIASAPRDWKEYNLVILNGVRRIDATMGRELADALQQGQSVCVFPGRVADPAVLNEGLQQVGDIRITGIDTGAQAASSIQPGNALVRDLFERIPDNVQLPVATWHYIINAGLSANQQSVLSFRNGDPFLAGYTPSRGQLYICATSADLQSGNFPGSYFFTPFLYQMAVHSGGSSVYAITEGAGQAVFLPMTNVSERNTVHVYGRDMDVIPPQRPDGAGLDVFLDQVVRLPGFYALSAPGADTTLVALNQDKAESALGLRDIKALKEQWNGDNVKWLSISDQDVKGDKSAGNFPLWKVCVILALLMLAAETLLLVRPTVARAV